MTEKDETTNNESSDDELGKVPEDDSTESYASLRERVLSSIAEQNELKDKGMNQPFDEIRRETPFTEDKEIEPEIEEPKFESVYEEQPFEEEEASRSRIEWPESAREKESKQRQAEHKKEQSMVKKIVTIVILALIVVVAIVAFASYRYVKTGLQPLDAKDKQLVQIEVPIGTSNKGIGTILEKNKVIKSGLIFTYYVKTNNIGDFQGGFYQMSPDMELGDIAEMLQQGGTPEAEALADAKITVPEGFSIDQIAELIGKKTDYSKDDFLKAVDDDKYFAELLKAYPKLLDSTAKAKGVRYRLEGYLFPATYNFYQKDSLEDFITQMVDKTNSVLATYEESLANSKLTTQEILTLASLVEKEGVTMPDRQKIAQVFFNRIEAEMPLQSDISVLYAMEKHKVHLSDKDTQIDSPYNLYIHKGFGPGPFNNPSQEAIDAVLNPEANDDLYFLADVDTGKVYFAKDYEEHLRLKEKYIDSKND